MNTLKFVILAIFLFALSSPSMPKAATVATEAAYAIKLIEQANVYSRIDSLKKAHDILSGLKNSETGDLTVKYYLAWSEYNLLQFSYRKEYAGLYDQFITSAETLSGQLSNCKGYEAEGKVLLAGVYMMKIAHNWSEAISLSPKFYLLLDEAEKLDKENPRIFYMRGLMKFNTPEMFGGSKEEALKLFLKAGKLAEDAEDEVVKKQPGVTDTNLKPSWGKLESYIWAGQVYAKMENLQTAKFYYDKVLSIEPEYAWVKYYLLPSIAKQMKAKQ